MMILGKEYELEEEVLFSGVGLHSGRDVVVRILPRLEEGILFVREDLGDREGDREVLVSYDRVVSTSLCTLLRSDDGVEVQTIEHLMAAFYMLGIKRAVVRITASELPILDGSAFEFIEGLRGAINKEPCGEIEWVARSSKIEVVSDGGDARIVYSPWEDDTVDRLELNFEIDYDNLHIGRQKLSLRLGQEEDDVISILGRARTFCLLRDLEQIRMMGLAKGGSLENAVVIGEEGVINPEGYLFENECVRHKMMDCLGDMWTSQKYISGRIDCYKSGHSLNNRFVREFYSS